VELRNFTDHREFSRAWQGCPRDRTPESPCQNFMSIGLRDQRLSLETGYGRNARDFRLGDVHEKEEATLRPKRETARPARCMVLCT
jgi:hypothetical protein